jgi:transcriptional antiterminator NusG
MALYLIKTKLGAEKLVMSTVKDRAKKKKLQTYSIIIIPELRGYVIIEAEHLYEVENGVRDLQDVKQILGTIPYSEIEHFLKAETVKDVNRGDVVEIIEGPFRGEKARITRVDHAKAEVTIELVSTVVPIPITLGMRAIRRIDKAISPEEKENV